MKRPETSIGNPVSPKFRRIGSYSTPYSDTSSEFSNERQQIGIPTRQRSAQVNLLDLPTCLIFKIFSYFQLPQNVSINWAQLSSSTFPVYHALSPLLSGCARGLQLSCSTMLQATLMYHNISFTFDPQTYHLISPLSEPLFQFFLDTLHSLRTLRNTVLPPLPEHFLHIALHEISRARDCETIRFCDDPAYSEKTYAIINDIQSLNCVDLSFPSELAMDQLIARGLPTTTELILRNVPMESAETLLLSFFNRSSGENKRAVSLKSVSISLHDDFSSGLINREKSEAYFDKFFRTLKRLGRTAFKGLAKLCLSVPLNSCLLNKIERTLCDMQQKGKSFLDDVTEVELIHSTHSVIAIPSLKNGGVGGSTNRFMSLQKISQILKRYGLYDPRFLNAFKGVQTIVIENGESLSRFITAFKQHREIRGTSNISVLSNIPITAVDVLFRIYNGKGSRSIDRGPHLVETLSIVLSVFPLVEKLSISSEMIPYIGKSRRYTNVVQKFFAVCRNIKYLTFTKLSDLILHERHCNALGATRETDVYLNILFRKLPTFMCHLWPECPLLKKLSLQTSDELEPSFSNKISQGSLDLGKSAIISFRSRRPTVDVSDFEAVLNKNWP